MTEAILRALRGVRAEKERILSDRSAPIEEKKLAVLRIARINDATAKLIEEAERDSRYPHNP